MCSMFSGGSHPFPLRKNAMLGGANQNRTRKLYTIMNLETLKHLTISVALAQTMVAGLVSPGVLWFCSWRSG